MVVWTADFKCAWRLLIIAKLLIIWYHVCIYIYNIYIYVFIPGHSNYIEQLLSGKDLRYCFAWSSCPSSGSTSLALEDPCFPQSRNWFTGKITMTTSIILYWVKSCFPVLFFGIRHKHAFWRFSHLCFWTAFRTRDGSKPVISLDFANLKNINIQQNHGNCQHFEAEVAQVTRYTLPSSMCIVSMATQGPTQIQSPGTWVAAIYPWRWWELVGGLH